MDENIVSAVKTFIHTMDKVSEFMNAIVPALFFLAGSVAFFLYVQDVYRLRSRKNSIVTATVTKSEISEYLRRSGGRARMIYKPIIEYTYEVDGLKYHSSQIAHSKGECSSNHKYQIEALLKAYPLDKSVSAYVNSTNHEDVYLQERAPNQWILIAVGIGFIASSFVIHAILN